MAAGLPVRRATVFEQLELSSRLRAHKPFNDFGSRLRSCTVALRRVSADTGVVICRSRRHSMMGQNTGQKNSARVTGLVAIALTGLLSMSMAAAGPLEDLTPGHWYEVPNSQLRQMDPCPARNCSYSGNEGQSGVIDDWTGAAFATGFGTKGAYLAFGGGHGGYLGNEVYAFDVGTLKWLRLTEPVVNGNCNYTEAEFADGSPCSAHTYDGVEYHARTNSFVILGACCNDNSINSSPRVHLLDLGTKKWRRGASYPGGGAPHDVATAYDPNRDAYWTVPGFNAPVGMYDPNANSGAGKWALYNPFNIDTLTVGAIDPGRDIFVVLDGLVKHQIVVFDLKNPNAPVKISFSGDSAPVQTTGAGFEWDPVQKAFVAWIGGASVYRLTPPSGDWRSGVWQWTKVGPAADNSVTPTAVNGNKPYSHWRYVPAVNAWMIVNRTSDNVFFYKMSENPIKPQPPTNVTAQ
jgi:hypothetical protein